MEFRHKHKIQVRFTDLDEFAHVNNNVQFGFLDDAKYNYFASLFGKEFFDGRGIVVANVEANFLSPVFYPGELEISTTITKIGTKSMTVFQRMCDATTGDLKTECRTVIVAWDVAGQRSLELSPDQKQRIRDFEGLE